MNSWKNIGIFAFSALSLGIVACSGSDGAPGPAGAAGAAGEAGAAGPAGAGVPSAGLIVPNVGLIDRELDVTITAQSVDFTAAAPTLDFGPGVKTSNIQVLSPTTLVAHLAVDVAAKTGARDVKITEGSTSVTSKAGFTVASSIAATTAPTQAVQGGILVLSLDNLDQKHPFDANFDLFSGGYDNLDIGLTTDGATFSQPNYATAYHAEGTIVLLDPTAGTTTQVIAANFNPNTGAPVDTFASDPIPVAARTASTLTPGTPLTAQTLPAGGASNLYKYTTAAISILEVTATATGAKVDPILVAYGPSGKVADLKIVGASFVYPTPAASTAAYLVAFDKTGAGGAVSDYGYTVSATAHTGTAFNEPAAAHATLATAATVTPVLPVASTNNGVVIVGAATTATEEDWYTVTLAKDDNLELSADSAKDITIDVTDATSTSILAQGPISGGGVVSVTQTVTAAGSHPYYIHVTSTTSTAGGAYLISLRQR